MEVRLEEESVWLTQAQMAELFQSSKQNISLHISKVYKEGKLQKAATVKDYLTVQTEGGRSVRREVDYYNLDVIISVGYRVKSKRGVQFRQWASQVLKDYLLKGYSINQRFAQLEEKTDARLANHSQQIQELQHKVAFFVHTSLPPVEGVFFDGQIFDAYVFAADLIRQAKKSLILIDNYVDEKVLLMLSKRDIGVDATIYTARITAQFQLDVSRHNTQYPAIHLRENKQFHDRFLVIDGVDVYHIGASLKDLGKKWFAFSKMSIPAQFLLEYL